jgi:hypothetical protein
VYEQQSLFDASGVLIEGKSSGTQLIRELISKSSHGIAYYQPTAGKSCSAGVIENWFVYIRPWQDEYLDEMTGTELQADSNDWHR